MSIQSATGEVLRLKRMRRMSSDPEDEASGGGVVIDGASPAKVVVTAADLAYYSGGGSISVGGTTITLPNTPTWSQADLEHAASIGGKFWSEFANYGEISIFLNSVF